MNIIEKLLSKGLTNKPLTAVKGIVIHWVANPNTSAASNRNYWENLGSGVSAHYIIDLNGDVLHCVPDNMMAYQVGAPKYTSAALSRLSSYPNNCVIGIECTHTDWNGKMTDATYASLVSLAAKLLKAHNLTTDNLWLHSEIVGKSYKDCHRWFTTTRPEDWPTFKNNVQREMNPKMVYVVTGGYSGQALAEMQAYIASRKWWYNPSRNDDGTISFYVGSFGEGSEAVNSFVAYLKSKNYWYEIQNG
jgi:N-acetylmuramoyl-L-alanine amidase